MDNQVKLRGFRIELSEIESVMRELSGVTNAIVRKTDSQHEQLLCVAEASLDITTQEELDSLQRDVTSHLKQKLPHYMVPAQFLCLLYTSPSPRDRG